MCVVVSSLRVCVVGETGTGKVIGGGGMCMCIDWCCCCSSSDVSHPALLLPTGCPLLMSLSPTTVWSRLMTISLLLELNEPSLLVSTCVSVVVVVVSSLLNSVSSESLSMLFVMWCEMISHCSGLRYDDGLNHLMKTQSWNRLSIRISWFDRHVCFD